PAPLAGVAPTPVDVAPAAGVAAPPACGVATVTLLGPPLLPGAWPDGPQAVATSATPASIENRVDFMGNTTPLTSRRALGQRNHQDSCRWRLGRIASYGIARPGTGRSANHSRATAIAIAAKVAPVSSQPCRSSARLGPLTSHAVARPSS